ncbi:MAG TPA: preprotein translocase subunit YajC [Tepidisphaeraceae bacterium]|nr:preprotein translocase subunit YajC [Tepidisphaeraceae bacterium]
MNALMIIVAQSTPPAGGNAPPPAFQFLQSFGPFILLLVVLWFFVIRSKQKEAKVKRDMLDSLKKNDRIETIGGVLGTVVEVRDGEVVVKVDETSNTKMRFRRSAIHRVLSDDEKK